MFNIPKTGSSKNFEYRILLCPIIVHDSFSIQEHQWWRCIFWINFHIYAPYICVLFYMHLKVKHISLNCYNGLLMNVLFFRLNVMWIERSIKLKAHWRRAKRKLKNGMQHSLVMTTAQKSTTCTYFWLALPGASQLVSLVQNFRYSS